MLLFVNKTPQKVQKTEINFSPISVFCLIANEMELHLYPSLIFRINAK